MKKNKKFNNLKKSIKNFIKDEEGFVTKENILKVGIGTISALGIIGAASNSFGGTTHTNTSGLVQEPIPNTQCWKIRYQHNDTIHSSY